jgi:hypothetical protein
MGEGEELLTGNPTTDHGLRHTGVSALFRNDVLHRDTNPLAGECVGLGYGIDGHRQARGFVDFVKAGLVVGVHTIEKVCRPDLVMDKNAKPKTQPVWVGGGASPREGEHLGILDRPVVGPCC